MMKLAGREDGRLRQEIIKVDHDLNNLKEQKNISEVSPCISCSITCRTVVVSLSCYSILHIYVLLGWDVLILLFVCLYCSFNILIPLLFHYVLV